MPDLKGLNKKMNDRGTPPGPNDVPPLSTGKTPPDATQVNNNLDQMPRETLPKKKQSVARLSMSLDEDTWESFLDETVRLNKGRKGSQKDLFLLMWKVYKNHILETEGIDIEPKEEE